MRRYTMEFIGTFFLLLTVGLSANPLAIGAALAALVYMGGYISGAHYNPAVTLAVLIRGKISSHDALKYVAAQLLGAVAAAAAYFSIQGEVLKVAPAAGVDFNTALLVEIIFTFLLAFTVLNVATAKKTDGNPYFGLAIGLALMVGAFSGGAISGGAFNPAVGIGPLLFDISQFGQHWSDFWLYLVGPLAGGALAALVFRSLTPDKELQ